MTTVPAMVNVHSHAFQRDLRGRAEGSGDFWTWRAELFALAGALDPDSMHDVALRAYREMRRAGYGAVGEFHYVHHPDAMAHAVVAAAQEAGLPMVLLPAAYHRNGWDGGDRPLEGGQRRFGDPSADAFLERVDALREAGVQVGVAAHSVRAVPAAWLERIAEYAERHGLVRHVHAQEQPRELDECRAEHGCTPIELLERTGFLGPRTTVVHGIHVTPRDVELMARTRSIAATCPTTEGNLGDGWFPVGAYRRAGVRIAVGSDSNVRIDPFEEVRELETGARRASGRRTDAGGVWDALARAGAESLGLDGPGTIEVDREHADLAGVADADLPAALATCASAGVVVTR